MQMVHTISGKVLRLFKVINNIRPGDITTQNFHYIIRYVILCVILVSNKKFNNAINTGQSHFERYYNNLCLRAFCVPG